MRHLGSLIISAADQEKVPAGGALAVDREKFSAAVDLIIVTHPMISVEREEVTDIPDDWDQVIIATGPLTSPALAEKSAHGVVKMICLFDAIAPIIHFDSINTDIVWFQSRYDKSTDGGDGKDYINCPLNKSQYDSFIEALLNGEKMKFKEWEGKYSLF